MNLQQAMLDLPVEKRHSGYRPGSGRKPLVSKEEIERVKKLIVRLAHPCATTNEAAPSIAVFDGWVLRT